MSNRKVGKVVEKVLGTEGANKKKCTKNVYSLAAIKRK